MDDLSLPAPDFMRQTGRRVDSINCGFVGVKGIVKVLDEIVIRPLAWQRHLGACEQLRDA
jgi:hypothetical protein